MIFFKSLMRRMFLSFMFLSLLACGCNLGLVVQTPERTSATGYPVFNLCWTWVGTQELQRISFFFIIMPNVITSSKNVTFLSFIFSLLVTRNAEAKNRTRFHSCLYTSSWELARTNNNTNNMKHEAQVPVAQQQYRYYLLTDAETTKSYYGPSHHTKYNTIHTRYGYPSSIIHRHLH